MKSEKAPAYSTWLGVTMTPDEHRRTKKALLVPFICGWLLLLISTGLAFLWNRAVTACFVSMMALLLIFSAGAKLRLLKLWEQDQKKQKGAAIDL